MKRLSEEDGLKWAGGEVSSAVPAEKPRVGKATLAAYAFGMVFGVVGVADKVQQSWGR